MSLLEDVFLEDEAGEAQDLERIIEGDDYDERPRSPNSDDNEEKDDEAEEDKRRVDPTQTKTKRVVKNPRFILNPARLTGPRGIQVIPDHFKDFKFKGKGHEKEDLDMVLKKLEHWAYRLYPKFGFHDCLKKIEMLGKKRPVMVHLQKIRSDQLVLEEAVVQRDSSDDEREAPAQEDEFDRLLQQQIELARATPARGEGNNRAFGTPTALDRSLMMPKATSSPSISDEQRERMLRNRQLAEERRLAKLRNDNSVETPKENNVGVLIEPDITKEVVTRKHNRSHVIDSSDEDEPTITVDMHGIIDDDIDVEINNKKETPNQNSGEIFKLDFDKEVIDEAVVRKHNRSHVINSSDEDEVTVNRSIAVNEHGIVDDEVDDVTKKVIGKVTRKNYKPNIIDSSDEDEPVVKKSTAVDVELNDMTEDSETPKVITELSREVIDDVVTQEPNAIDSSESDDDAPMIHRSITVDVHEDVKISVTNQEELNHLITTNCDTIQESDILNVANTSNSDTSENKREGECNSIIPINDQANTETNKINTDIELSNADNNTKHSDEASNKENVDIDEMMDVDFSEDF